MLVSYLYIFYKVAQVTYLTQVNTPQKSHPLSQSWTGPRVFKARKIKKLFCTLPAPSICATGLLQFFTRALAAMGYTLTSITCTVGLKALHCMWWHRRTTHCLAWGREEESIGACQSVGVTARFFSILDFK